MALVRFMLWLILLLTIVLSYLLGAIPFGYLVARMRGVDILKTGSGNIGATNVGRVLGRTWGLIVFVLDFAKGACPALTARLLEPSIGLDLAPGVLPVAAAVSAFLGHLFPIYLGFRGGKGVATGIGAITVLMPAIAGVVVLAWVALLASSRFVSVASLGATLLMLVLRLATMPHPFASDHLAVTLFCFIGTALVWLRHAGNITRLVQGTENRFKETSTMLFLGKAIHVLALGLWFGSAVFFTLTGLIVFETFEKESLEQPRKLWFPLPEVFDQPRPSDKFPEPLKKEQGARVAATALAPLFDWYYGLQVVCALLATVTACGWLSSPSGGGHKVRAKVLALALITVAIGWWMEREVHELRGPRNEKTDAVLMKSYSDRAVAIGEAEKARANFGMWHGLSVMLNLLTLLLVTIAMVLAAAVPSARYKKGTEQLKTEAPILTSPSQRI